MSSTFECERLVCCWVQKNDLPEWGGHWRAPSRGDNSACAGLPLLLGCLDSSDAHFRLIGLAAIGQDACFNWLFFLDQSVLCEAVLHLSHQGVIKAVQSYLPNSRPDGSACYMIQVAIDTRKTH